MTDLDTAPVLLTDYGYDDATLVATNLAIDPGYDTSLGELTYTNLLKYPSAGGGSLTGWTNNLLNLSVVNDSTMPSGKAWSGSFTAYTGVMIKTDTSADGIYLPGLPGISGIAGIHVRTTSAIGMRLRVYEVTPTGGLVGTLNTYSWTTSGTGAEWVTVTFTPTDPINNTVMLEVATTAAFTGSVFVDGAMVLHDESYDIDYFDGSYVSDPLLSSRWDGVPYESTSSLVIPLARTGSGGFGSTWPMRSPAWQSHGQYSLALIPFLRPGITTETFSTIAGDSTDLSGGQATFVAGETYTVKAKLRIETPSAYALNAAAYTLQATYNGTGGTTVSSVASPNAQGTYDHTLTFTIPANATYCYVAAWNGTTDQTVYWDDLLIYTGSYSGEWFSGAYTPAGNYVTAWTGDEYASPSTLSIPTGPTKIASLKSLTIDYTGINSVYGDDDSLPLGVASFSFDSPRTIKNYMGQAVHVVRNDDQPRKVLVRSISRKFDQWNLTADMGETDRNYEYSFVPVTSTAGGITFTTIQGSEFSVIGNDGTVPYGTLPGYVGNGLSAVAQLAQAYGGFAYDDSEWDTFSISSVPYGEAYVSHPNNISGWDAAIERAEPAKSIEVVWYETTSGTDIEVVPTDANTITVDASETVTVEIDTGAWLNSVNQPICVDWVEADENYYDNTPGVYAVAGSDNLPVEPDEWEDNGGSLSVAISEEDPRILVVTVTGMDRIDLAPYRIAMTSGNFYPALRVTADAVRTTPHTVRIPTGVDESLTKTEVGFTIDNPYITSADQAYSVGARTASKYTGYLLTLTGAGEGIEPTQLLDHDDMRFIVRDVSGGVSKTKTFVAEQYTRMGDFEEVWDGYTMGDFENVWDGYTMGQFMVAMLRNPLRTGTGYFFDLYNGLWWSDSVTDNGDGTWTSDIPIDNGDGTWTA